MSDESIPAVASDARERQTPEEGIHYGIDMDEYRHWDAVAVSDLSALKQSPSNCYHRMHHPKESTKAQKFGSFVHCALLEPEELESRYCVEPPCPPGRNPKGWHGTDDYKALKTDLEDQGYELVSEKNWDAAPWIRDNAANHPVGQLITQLTTGYEISVAVQDPQYPLMRKIRPDQLLYGADMIVDTKVTRSITRRGFALECAKFGYHRSAAYYLDTINLLEGFDRFKHYVFFPIAADAPHECRAYTLGEDDVQLGRDQYRDLLDMFNYHAGENHWPDGTGEIEEISLPGWAFNEEM